jgi:chromosome segregation ATPase
MKTLNKQLSESGERETQLSRRIESLIDKEIELTEELNAIKKENKKFKSIIVDQKNEIKMYLRKESDLTEKLRRERSFPDKFSSPSKILQSVRVSFENY